MTRSRTDGELSAAQQIARMQKEYPGFAVLYTTPWIIIWQGELTPYGQQYQIHMLYCAFALPLAGIEANTVHVEVASPLLTARPSHPHVPIPHLYPNRRLPSRPRLCLHTAKEWDPSMVIADTIVPWTVEWLAAYEAWKATGTWYAGGHNTERERLFAGRQVQR